MDKENEVLNDDELDVVNGGAISDNIISISAGKDNGIVSAKGTEYMTPTRF